jgi:hypothetical protein
MASVTRSLRNVMPCLPITLLWLEHPGQDP